MAKRSGKSFPIHSILLQSTSLARGQCTYYMTSQRRRADSIPAAFWTLDGQHHCLWPSLLQDHQASGKALTLPGLYLSLLVKTRVIRGRLLHTSTIIPQYSAVLEWQLEAARWFPKRPCRFYEITIN